jgi:hypothetical protein
MRGTVSSEGLGMKIKCDTSSLEPVSIAEWYSDVKDRESLSYRLHLRCGGDRARATRYVMEFRRFLESRPDINSIEQLMQFLVPRRN